MGMGFRGVSRYGKIGYNGATHNVRCVIRFFSLGIKHYGKVNNIGTGFPQRLETWKIKKVMGNSWNMKNWQKVM